MQPQDTTQPQYIPLPRKAKDITNQRFGRLVALGPIGRTSKSQITWLCQCDCGNTTMVAGADLRNGKTQSCGCLRKERTVKALTKHGMAKTRINSIWKNIIRRCNIPSCSAFVNYGGRGISICDEWRDSFLAFHDHISQLPHYGEKGYSLDRVNNSLGYFPGNVRWATRTEQNRNSRHNILLTYNGKTQCLSEWAEETGIKAATLQARVVSYGWDAEKALTTPVQNWGR